MQTTAKPIPKKEQVQTTSELLFYNSKNLLQKLLLSTNIATPAASTTIL